MRILVVQLARLGDIYQTAPVLSALKRQNPGAEIHLLTRSKFATAASVCRVDHHWLLDTREVLAPLVDEKPDFETSLAKLAAFTGELRDVGFDKIVNLTFSAFSSYLVREIASSLCEVRGYTRFRDGFLSIPDDGSAYFYAQVGVGRPNRVHVIDLFAFVAGVDLTEDDWKIPQPKAAVIASEAVQQAGDNAVVIHVGASDLNKTLSWSKWMQVVKGLLSAHSGNVVLIGSKEEAEIAAQVAAVAGPRTAVNLVGKTSLDELFAIVGRARLLVGGDSGPVQIATLTGTKTLNVSLPMVSFWETGPRAKGSRILPLESEQAISAEELVSEAMSMLADTPSKLPIVRVPGPIYPYVETRPQPMSFEWELLRALYMGEAFPPAPSELFLNGVARLNETNELAMEQVAALARDSGNKTASAILDQADQIMGQIQAMVPEVAPLLSWFRTERVRIGPMPVESLIEATGETHKRFGEILALYVDLNAEGGDDDIILG